MFQVKKWILYAGAENVQSRMKQHVLPHLITVMAGNREHEMNNQGKLGIKKENKTVFYMHVHFSV